MDFFLLGLIVKVRHYVEERRTLNFKEQYFDVWTAVWNLHKKYHGIRQQDEQKWQELDQACEQLDEKYRGEPEQKFAESLLLAVCAELEERSKDEKN